MFHLDAPHLRGCCTESLKTSLTFKGDKHVKTDILLYHGTSELYKQKQNKLPDFGDQFEQTFDYFKLYEIFVAKSAIY